MGIHKNGILTYIYQYSAILPFLHKSHSINFSSFKKFIYFRLCWVFVAAQAFLYVQGGGLFSRCGSQVLHRGSFSCCGA